MAANHPPRSTPELRTYLELLADDAHRLVHVVHHDRQQARDRARELLHAPHPPGVDPAEALALTLAAMADPRLPHIEASAAPSPA